MHPREPRRGVTLLEVLISIFVIAVGLLGVAALLPVGGTQYAQASRLDHAAAVGRAAYHEVEIRRMLEPEHWMSATSTSNPVETNADFGLQPFVIDPLGCHFLDKSQGQFPAVLCTGGKPLPRISLAIHNESGNLIKVSRAVADRIFTSFDDKTYNRPKDASKPPLVGQLDANENPQTWQQQKADFPYGQPEGKFAWFVTVSLVPGETALQQISTQKLDAERRRLYNVAVVVTYSRSFSLVDTPEIPPAERMVKARTTATSYHGGDFLFEVDNQDQWRRLQLAPNQWVMLSGTTNDGRMVARWYRVRGVGELEDRQTAREVSLDGPDWNPQAFNGQIHASICDTVLAVYEKTMKLDFSTLWGE